MAHTYSLAYLTSAPMAPPDALVLAHKLDYQGIGIRIAPAAPGGDFSPLATNRAMLRETIRRMADRCSTSRLRDSAHNSNWISAPPF
jgi:hypothetical protein